MANMQVAIRFRGETGDDFVYHTLGQITGNCLLNKIERFAFVCHTADPTEALRHKWSGIIAFRLLRINN